MDETAMLKEGEIYCSIHGDEGMQILTGDVIVTKSPALHPGDIQSVKTVNVPPWSALNDLHNVVVFSSKGERVSRFYVYLSVSPLTLNRFARSTLAAQWRRLRWRSL